MLPASVPWVVQLSIRITASLQDMQGNLELSHHRKLAHVNGRTALIVGLVVGLSLLVAIALLLVLVHFLHLRSRKAQFSFKTQADSCLDGKSFKVIISAVDLNLSPLPNKQSNVDPERNGISCGELESRLESNVASSKYWVGTCALPSGSSLADASWTDTERGLPFDGCRFSSPGDQPSKRGSDTFENTLAGMETTLQVHSLSPTSTCSTPLQSHIQLPAPPSGSLANHTTVRCSIRADPSSPGATVHPGGQSCSLLLASELSPGAAAAVHQALASARSHPEASMLHNSLYTPGGALDDDWPQVPQFSLSSREFTTGAAGPNAQVPRDAGSSHTQQGTALPPPGSCAPQAPPREGEGE